jgi:DNA polymerase V
MKEIELIELEKFSENKIPLYSMSVPAGSPFEVDSDIDKEIDLNELLVEHPANTFFAKFNGVSSKEIGVETGDILVVDSSINPDNGKIVLVSLNDDFSIKIYRTVNNNIYLESQTDNFVPLKIEPYMEYKIIGVVTKIIHSFN